MTERYSHTDTESRRRELTERYYSGITSPEEESELRDILQAADVADEETQILLTLLGASSEIAAGYASAMPEGLVERMEDNICRMALSERMRRSVRRRRILGWSAAAAVALLLTAGAGFFRHSVEVPELDNLTAEISMPENPNTASQESAESEEKKSRPSVGMQRPSVAAASKSRPAIARASAGAVGSRGKKRPAVAEKEVQTPSPEQIAMARSTLEDAFAMLNDALEEARVEYVDAIDDFDGTSKIMKL